jgi:uncharacterized membrane protein
MKTMPIAVLALALVSLSAARPQPQHELSEPNPALKDAAARPQVPQLVETFETVQPVVPPVTLLTLIGRLHPAMVHFPIGWLIALVLVDTLTFVVGRKELWPAGQVLLGVTVLSFIAAGATGFLRANQLPADAATQHAIADHRNVMLLSFALVVVAAILRWALRGQLAGPRKAAYLGLVLLAAALVLFGGHLGGRLVFGDSYLPF